MGTSQGRLCQRPSHHHKLGATVLVCSLPQSESPGPHPLPPPGMFHTVVRKGLLSRVLNSHRMSHRAGHFPRELGVHATTLSPLEDGGTCAASVRRSPGLVALWLMVPRKATNSTRTPRNIKQVILPNLYIHNATFPKHLFTYCLLLKTIL